MNEPQRYLLAAARTDAQALLIELAPTPLGRDRELCLQLSRLSQLAHELWALQAVPVGHAAQLRDLGAWFLEGSQQPGAYGEATRTAVEITALVAEAVGYGDDAARWREFTV